MIAVEQFIGKYQAMFNNFPGNPNNSIEMGEWRRVLAKIPPGQIDAVFAMVCDILGNSVKSPRTREFERAIRLLWSNSQRGGGGGFVGDACGLCYGTGVISVWITVADADKSMKLGFHPGGYPYEFGLPCKCTKGRWMKERYWPKLSGEAHEAAYQWYVEQADYAKGEGVRTCRYIAVRSREALRAARFKPRPKQPGAVRPSWVARLTGKTEVARDDCSHCVGMSNGEDESR